MKCIVCDNDIRINSLRQLFSLQPLYLCSCCSQNLVPKSADVLFEDNVWIRSVIDRLNKGDIVLTKLFRDRLQKVLSYKGVTKSKIEIIEAKQGLEYPWLEILIDSINFKPKRKHSTITVEYICVSVHKQKSVKHQVTIVD